MKKKFISSMFLFGIIAGSFSNYATAILHASDSKAYTETIEQNLYNEEFGEVDVNYFEENIIDNNIIDNGNGLELNLSEFETSLLDESDIEQVNRNIEYINNGLDTGVLIYDENGDIVDAGGYEAITGQAGKTKVVFNWKYIDVYFSSATFQALAALTVGVGAVGCTAMTSGAGVTACMLAGTYVASYVSVRTAERFPNGAIVRVSSANKYFVASWRAQ